MKTFLIGISLVLTTILSAQSRTHNYAIGESRDLMMIKTKQILSLIDGTDDIRIIKHYVTDSYLDITVGDKAFKGRYVWVFGQDSFTMSGKEAQYFDTKTKTWKVFPDEYAQVSTNYMNGVINLLMNEIIF